MIGTPKLGAMKRPEVAGGHRSRSTQKKYGDHSPRRSGPGKSSKSDSRSDSRKSRHSSSKSASRESSSRISTMEPGRELEDAVVKDLAGMEKDVERRRAESHSRSHSRPNGKRPTTSPTPRSASSSKTLRMDREEDWARQVEKDLEKDENQNKAPDGRVGPNRSNGV